jgi:hypothetical protein
MRVPVETQSAAAHARSSAGRRRAWIVWAVSLAGITTMTAIALLVATGTIPETADWGAQTTAIYVLTQGSFAIAGAMVSGNRVGWILWVVALFLVLGAGGATLPPLVWNTAGATPLATGLAWQSELSVQLAYGLAIGFLPLLFPTGSLPSRRWLPVGGLATLLLLITTASAAFAPGPISSGYPVANPLGIGALADATDAIGLVQAVLIIIIPPACVLAQVSRFRSGGSLVRQQIKWFAAVALLVVAFIVAAILAPSQELANALWGIAMFGLPLLPVAIGIAILRYRLYEIDRLVSRTIGWTLVTGALVVVFAGGIIALQGALTGVTQGDTLAVAASTLVVFALFQPLRRRVQAAVDRRFDRSRWDSERVVAGFLVEARSEVDLDRLRLAAIGAVEDAVAPAGTAVWLRGEW